MYPFSPQGFPGGSVVRNPPVSAGDMGLIPGLGRSPRVEMATYSSILACPTDRGAWQPTVHGVAKESDMT